MYVFCRLQFSGATCDGISPSSANPNSSRVSSTSFAGECTILLALYAFAFFFLPMYLLTHSHTNACVCVDMDEQQEYTPNISTYNSPMVTPRGMTAAQFQGFMSQMSPDQIQMAQQMWGGQTSQTPVSNPTSQQETPIPSVPVTPTGAHASAHRRRRRSRGGGGCCFGSSSTDASTPPRERPPLDSVESTPRSRTSRRHDTGPPTVHAEGYEWRNRGVVMNDVGLSMKNRIDDLCHQVFQNDLMTKYPNLDKAKKNRIIDLIMQEFKPIPGGQVVDRKWIKDHMVDVLKHARGDVTRAVKSGGSRPWFCTQELWDREVELHAANPERYKQQEDAAKVRQESVGSSHLGKGGYERFHYRFVRINVHLILFNLY